MTALKVRFLISKAQRSLASSVVRGDQLSSLLQMRMPSLDVRVVSVGRLPPTPLRGAVVVINSTLFSRGGDWLRRLARSNKVLIDPVDAIIPADVGEACDGILAPSFTSESELRHRFPQAVVAHVPWVTNFEIPFVTAQHSKWRVAYVGGRSNGQHVDELESEGLLEVVETPYWSPPTEWAARLALFPAQFAMRQPQPWDGFKFFTKGFLAAQCGAVIVTPRWEPDVAHYLPESYPFFVLENSIQGARDAINRAREAFGGPDWRAAQQMMNSMLRSVSPAAAVEQLHQLMVSVINRDEPGTRSRRPTS